MKSRQKVPYDWWMTHKLLRLPSNNCHVVPDDSHVSAITNSSSPHLPNFNERFLSYKPDRTILKPSAGCGEHI